jgi:hypothetical protein
VYDGVDDLSLMPLSQGVSSPTFFASLFIIDSFLCFIFIPVFILFNMIENGVIHLHSYVVLFRLGPRSSLMRLGVITVGQGFWIR